MRYVLLLLTFLIFVTCTRNEDEGVPVTVKAIDLDTEREIQGGAITYKYELPSDGIPWFGWGPTPYRIDTIKIQADQTINSLELFNVDCKSLVSFHHKDYKTMFFYTYICLSEIPNRLYFECKKTNIARVTLFSSDTLRFFKMRNIIYPDSLEYPTDQTLAIDEIKYKIEDAPGIRDTTFYVEMLPGIINRIFISYQKKGKNGTFEMNTEIVPEYRDTFDLEFVLE